ncbi:PREDICTED: trace amine-associated receptor 1 [Nanorana parkeri]|uniref:trace amine-associated receptor 1 n=1 Tax=Nanorana parkeri TaxID=125878 RepID=UPI000854D3FF|nr:PREDICTED: trace amine-associated receptor 1 [Nanorana parkeri]
MQLQYCFETINKSCEKHCWPNSVKIPMYVFMVSTILATMAGNLAVIISIAHFKQLHTPTNYLILSMATVDFLLGCLVMPYSMVRSVENCWYFGDIFCKIHTGMDIMLSTASIFHLSFISVDRYYAVCHPLQYKTKINKFTVLVMILTSWVIPAIFAFGMIFLDLNIKGSEMFFYDEVYCIGGCFVFFSETSGVIASMLSFFIPGFVMICIYGKIYIIARRQARLIKDATSQIQFQASFVANQYISRCSERKAAKTLGTIMGVFLICWSPFFFSTAIGPFTNHIIPSIVIDAFVWVGYLNSTFNPMVYAFFYMWFRRALKMILFGKVFQTDSSRTVLYLE